MVLFLLHRLPVTAHFKIHILQARIERGGGNPTHGAAFGPGGSFKHPFSERADEDGDDDHADGSPEARDEVRLCMVGPGPDDQREDQRQSGCQRGELVEH